MSSPIRILVVDDESNVADALWQLLRMHHYDVSHFTSAEEALRTAHLQHYDVVITDLHMPGIGGMDLLEEIAQIAPMTRRMLITAYDSPLLRERIEGLVHAYLPKPFTLRRFIQAVQHQVNEITQSRIAEEPAQPHHFLHKIGARIMDRALRQGEMDNRPAAVTKTAPDEATQAQYHALESLLNTLQNDLQADIVFVADMLGQVVAEVGYAQNYEQADLVPIVSATFASIAELGNMVDGNSDAPLLWYREGDHFDLYMVNVSPTLYLCVLMGKRRSHMKPGVAWMALKRAVTTIRADIALDLLTSISDTPLDRSMASAIVNDLDSLFNQ